jgi:adenylate kinase
LLENVVPTVTEALIDSCKVLPEDPIDFFAEYLLQEAKSLKKRRQRKENQ